MAKIVERSLDDIPTLLLPAVLILKDNQACLLKEITADRKLGIVFPKLPEKIVYKKAEELSPVYSGYLIFIQPKVDAEKSSKALLVENFKWFWNTLWHYRHIYI